MANDSQNRPEDPKAAITRGKIPRNIIVGVGALAAVVIGGLGFHYQVQSDSKAKSDAEAKKAAQVQAPSVAPDVNNDLDEAIREQQAKARAEAAKAQRDPNAVQTPPAGDGLKPSLTAGDFQQSLGKSDIGPLAKANEQDNIFTSGFFPQRSKGQSGMPHVSSNPLDGIADPAAALARGASNAQKQMDEARAFVAAQTQQPSTSSINARREQFLSDASKQSLPTATGIAAQLPACTVPMGFRISLIANDALNSDLPGDGSATVKENIYGGRYGECLAIPQGAQLYFSYSGDIAVGQERIQVAGTRLTLPNHKVVPLLGMQAGDPDGYTGVSGDVNNHFLKIFGASLFIAVLEHRFDDSTTAQTAGPNGVTSYGSTAGQVAAQTAQTVMQRNQSIPPTITTKQGQEIILRLNRDITMEPYVD